MSPSYSSDFREPRLGWDDEAQVRAVQNFRGRGDRPFLPPGTRPAQAAEQLTTGNTSAGNRFQKSSVGANTASEATGRRQRRKHPRKPGALGGTAAFSIDP